jgi:hypothetical protein
MTFSSVPPGLAVVAAVCLASTASAQILTENAGVASPELPALREAIRALETRNVDELRSDMQGIYSFTPSLETRLSVPVIRRDVAFLDAGGTEVHDELFGFGDISLRAKYSLFQTDDVLESTRWAALFEGVLPTGEHHETENGIEIPRKLQLGTGGFGIGGGTVFTVIRDRHRFSAEVFYRHTTQHDGFQLGDSLSANLAYWYRISPARFPKDLEAQPWELRGVVELLTTHRFESHAASGLGDDGLEIWIAPGVQLFGSHGVLFEASVQLPVIQDIDDAFGRREWAATIALKILF